MPKQMFGTMRVRKTYEVSKSDGIASHFGLKRLIHDQNEILNDSSSSADETFTSQMNLAMESEVHSSLYLSCHYRIAYAKYNLQIYYPRRINTKFCIIFKKILIKSEKQLRTNRGTEHSKISKQMKWFTRSTKL